MKFRKLFAYALAIALGLSTGVYAALESVTHISDLVVTNPTASDPVSQADDHIRNIKSALKTDLIDAKLFASVGWVKLPNGLLYQWGRATTSSGSASVTYPVPCPTATLQTMASLQTAVVASPFFVHVADGTTTGTTVLASNTSGTGVSVTVKWSVICY